MLLAYILPDTGEEVKLIALTSAMILTAFCGSISATEGQAAGQGQTPRKGGFCICNTFLGADSVFSCEHLGKVTIRDIYAKGWRIAHMQDVKSTVGVVQLVIEEQR